MEAQARRGGLEQRLTVARAHACMHACNFMTGMRGLSLRMGQETLARCAARRDRNNQVCLDYSRM